MTCATKKDNFDYNSGHFNHDGGTLPPPEATHIPDDWLPPTVPGLGQGRNRAVAARGAAHH